MCDFHSPYYDIKDKHKEVAKAYLGSASYKPPKRVKDCIALYKKLQHTTAHRSLESAVSLADSINTLAQQTSSDSEQMAKLVKGIDKEIKTSGDVYIEMALTKEKLDLRKQSLDIAKLSTDLIAKIEKNIDSLLKLKQKVNRATYEANDSAKSINNFLIDKFLDDEI